jgi:hypothetical protein
LKGAGVEVGGDEGCSWQGGLKFKRDEVATRIEVEGGDEG